MLFALPAVKPREWMAAVASRRRKARKSGFSHAFATTFAPLRGPMRVSYVSMIASRAARIDIALLRQNGFQRTDAQVHLRQRAAFVVMVVFML